MAKALVSGLRARGVDVTTVFDEGMSGKTDFEQLEYSSAQSRVLYSFNVGDFCALHREFLGAGRAHAGIVLANRQRYSLGEQIRRLAAIVGAKAAEECVIACTFFNVI